MLQPSVRMIRQPPAYVPKAIVTADRTTTQSGTSNLVRSPDAIKRQRDRGHRLLRVVRSVRVGKEGSGENLEAAERAIDRRGSKAQPVDDQHQRDARRLRRRRIPPAVR